MTSSNTDSVIYDTDPTHFTNTCIDFFLSTKRKKDSKKTHKEQPKAFEWGKKKERKKLLKMNNYGDGKNREQIKK